MFKKTLISVAVASSLGLTGCFDSADSGANANPDYKINNPAIDGKTWPQFNPVTGQLPLPNDLIFDSEQGDGTFGVADTTPPVTSALNELSGASTVAPAVIQFNGMIDADSVDSREFILANPEDPTSLIPNPNQNVFLIELDYASGDPLRGLSNSEPPTIPLALTAQTALGGDETAFGELLGRVSSPAYRADVVELDGQSAIRILPLKPLDPQKRYVVVVTNEVLDINGDPIAQSPSYANITDENQPLGSSSLAPVRAIMNGLWEAIATNYFQVTNGARPDNKLTAENIALSYSFTTSNDEKVLQYIAEPAAWFADQLTASVKVETAKKTVGAAKFAANPKDPSLTVEAGYDFNGDGEITAADFDVNADGEFNASDFDWNGDGKFDYADTTASTTFAVQAFPIVAGPAVDPEGNCPISPGEDFINCVATGVAAQLSAALPTPTPDNRDAEDFVFGDNTPKPVALVSSAAASVYQSVAGQIAAAGGTPPTVLALEGTVSLPYYLGTSGSDILTNSWKADNALAAGLNAVFEDLGLSIPQADPTNSTAVNYIFPFPKKTTDVDVPALFIYPQSASTKGVIMFQHGITTDRSAALTFGTAMATLGYTVVAIDQPLHGVAAFTTEDQQEWAERILAGGQNVNPALPAPTEQNIAALIEGQLNVGFVIAATTTDPASPTPAETAQAIIDAVLGGGTSASFGVPTDDGMGGNPAANLDSAIQFLEGAENSVANAGSTIPGLAPQEGNERHFGVYAPAPGQIAAIDYEAGKGDSGSLFINLLNFLNTRDNNRQSVVDQMNLRVSLNDLDLTGFGGANLSTAQFNFAGHSLGTITGAPFVASVNANQLPVIQTSVGLAPSSYNDISAVNMLTPGGGIVRLLENSPTFAPQILAGLGGNGLAQGDANLETFLNVFQAAVDTVDPINFADNLNLSTPAYLISEVEGDTVIPNAADEALWGIASLTGTFNVEGPDGTEFPVTVDSFNAPLAGSRPLSLIFEEGVESDLFFTYTQEAFPAQEGEDQVNHGTPVSGAPASAFSRMVGEADVLFTPVP
ncbi:hypothetical protein LPB19_09270 [Marinobacter salinisoli]|uniref:Bacterial virulence factor lipase N-terminal domain-containing protein n=1 Tax=Marinobacter salinisoli TaxID=2769486 RepID=A0ABX7MPW7_9GAMM|nr:hypothetical protein [Marinobacter salinisoli]QSP93419.1 hypothetical protein LPB19_09270 [Marinobacter salinisoli]